MFGWPVFLSSAHTERDCALSIRAPISLLVSPVGRKSVNKFRVRESETGEEC